MDVNRTYKDSVFSLLFNDPAARPAAAWMPL
jgi:hypothetical protein